jgi:alkaline phosphatase D
VRNTLVASGDVHSFWAADLKRDFDAAKAPIVATEFVGGSITSQGPTQARVKALLGRNPDLRYGLGGRNGYAQVSLTPKAATVSFRVVGSVKEPTSAIATAQRFTVEAGHPGVTLS